MSEIGKTIKYIVRPGYVNSASAGNRHYITGKRLIDLYGVDWRECIIENTGKEIRGVHGKFIVLEPQLEWAKYLLEFCREITI